jgi:hypothetical protein
MSKTAIKSTVFERGDNVYFVSPVSPFTPAEAEVEEFAFAQELKKAAPNEHLKWLRGQYVEADTANKNGQVWSTDEVSMKSLTPMLMPVTVMHDTRSAVGLIADTRLLTPANDGVPKARLDNTLAIWAHRFPEVAEEIDHNYAQGTLMQSMECRAPQYDCGVCGQTFYKLPGGAERANWCAHLNEAAGYGARILGNVVFTGTGLLFGTQGQFGTKEGADPKAHLEVFQEEIAEHHEKAHREMGRPRRKAKRPRRHTSMDPVEISHSEYAELHKRPSVEEFAAEKKRADDAEAAKAETDRKLEAEEIARKAADEKAEKAEDELKTVKEEKAEADLRDERFGKLGDGFTAKLGEATKTNLKRDAGALDEAAWDERLKEVEELAGVKRDAKAAGGTPPDPLADPSAGSGGGSGDEFSQEEIASSAAGALGGGEDQAPSVHKRGSVARGLFGTKKEPAKS